MVRPGPFLKPERELSETQSWKQYTAITSLRQAPLQTDFVAVFPLYPSDPHPPPPPTTTEILMVEYIPLKVHAAL